MMRLLSVYVTYPNEQEAQKVTERLMESRLVACANGYPIQSTYRWQSNLVNDQEWACHYKTLAKNMDKIEQVITDLHSYEIPCILKTKIKANRPYAKWVKAQCC